jgi:hypothetical protein
VESESEVLYDWRFTANQFFLAMSPLRLTGRFCFHLNTCGHCPYVTFSLTRGRVCRLQLLLVLASAFILRSEFRRTHGHILLSHSRDSPNLGRVRVRVRVRVRATLRLAVYHQSVCLGVEPLETHGQNFCF